MTNMGEGKRKLALYPGSFDPITNGHVDVIRRGAALFDELVIGVGVNPDKEPFLDQDRRVEIVREVVAELPNVRVAKFDGLTVDFARKLTAIAILRGIRDISDLHREFQIALTNRLVADVETVFIMTSSEYAVTSSSLIRQIAQMGGDPSALVPPQVLPHIRKDTGSTKG